MKKKRKYVRRKITTEVAIKEITRIRARNNRRWMQILLIASKEKPATTRALMLDIVKNDQEITKWMGRL